MPRKRKQQQQNERDGKRFRAQGEHLARLTLDRARRAQEGIGTYVPTTRELQRAANYLSEQIAEPVTCPPYRAGDREPAADATGSGSSSSNAAAAFATPRSAEAFAATREPDSTGEPSSRNTQTTDN